MTQEKTRYGKYYVIGYKDGKIGSRKHEPEIDRAIDCNNIAQHGYSAGHRRGIERKEKLESVPIYMECPVCGHKIDAKLPMSKMESHMEENHPGWLRA